MQTVVRCLWEVLTPLRCFCLCLLVYALNLLIFPDCIQRLCVCVLMLCRNVRLCMCSSEVNRTPISWACLCVWRRLVWNLLSHACVCFLSLSHSDVCPPTGQCPNGLSCFPSLSFCKYSGSRSSFTRVRPSSVHACLKANMYTQTQCYILHTPVCTSDLSLYFYWSGFGGQ